MSDTPISSDAGLLTTFSAILHEKRVLLLLFITLMAIGWVFVNGGPLGGGLKFGIDFSGGLRIPVLLERPIDPPTMQEMVNTIKTRAATFGLTEVRVRPVGDSEIYIEVPKSNPGLARDITTLLSQQGVFQAVVDGQVAVAGEDLYLNTIARAPSGQLGGSDWGVDFSITQAGQQRFSSVVRGKANYPLYMFVDRPVDAIVILSRTDLMVNANATGTSQALVRDSDALSYVSNALQLASGDVPVYLQEDIVSNNSNVSLKPATNRTRAIISIEAPASLKAKLNASGFVLDEKAPADMRPHYTLGGSGVQPNWVSRWEAVGLKSAFRLDPRVTSGAPSFSYVVTGAVDGTGSARQLAADRAARETTAVLKGGALPVQITIGSVQEVPAPLGQEFLRLSAIGAMFAMLCISLMVAIRYRTLKVIVPIVFISVSEVIILVAILGSFSIDLAAMAGVIAAIGVSVDAQIVVTDEILKHKHAQSAAHGLDKAFEIIVTNAIVATAAMLPLLLFSGLVEIIGFATSTVLGYLLGVLITRPAYGVIVQHILEGKKSN
jgi:preprotein translocase subunit SecD